MSRKNPDPKHQWPITEAAEKAELLIRGLQSRLAADVVQSGDVQPIDVQPDDPAENLDLELQGYFAAEETNHVAASRREQDLRKRVVDGVVEKILNSCDWSQDGRLTPQFENEVIERLVERVFERLVQTQGEPPARPQREFQEPAKSPARQVNGTPYRT